MNGGFVGWVSPKGGSPSGGGGVNSPKRRTVAFSTEALRSSCPASHDAGTAGTYAPSCQHLGHQGRRFVRM